VIKVGPELDAARARVVERDLTAQAVGQLTDVVNGLSLEALAPVKRLLKRFFSSEPWTADDDEALADAIGPTASEGSHQLEPGLTLSWGLVEGEFRLRVESRVPNDAPLTNGGDLDLAETFDGVVVPEATPSPRTIRFATPPLHTGPSRVYDSRTGSRGDDPRVARIFGAFDEVTNVLVGPDFVAVTIARPNRWPTLLGAMLSAVTEEFTRSDAGDAPAFAASTTTSARAGDPERDPRALRRLERAWDELGALRADQPDQLERTLEASADADPARRQVAAALLVDAPPETARRAWEGLLGDSSRAVRRSVVDAVAGTGRQELRRLLEDALDDIDAWIRWKALRGIAELGPGPSRAVVEARATDPDFRVRLEAARVLTVALGS
jgi:Scaffold protein Nfu/NifU N terminal